MLWLRSLEKFVEREFVEREFLYMTSLIQYMSCTYYTPGTGVDTKIKETTVPAFTYNYLIYKARCMRSTNDTLNTYFFSHLILTNI